MSTNHHSSPDHFNEEWLGKIATNVGAENWRLRVSNVKKLLDALHEFYDVSGQPLSPAFAKPDANLIGRDLDIKELGRLLQLILGCAVNSDRKEFFIENIMGLELDLQLSVKSAIEELMSTNRDRDSSGSLSNMFPDSLNLDQLHLLKESLKKTTVS